MRAIAALMLALFLSPAAAATPEEAARAAVETLVQATHAALADPGLAPATRTERLTGAITDGFALDLWQRFLLGDAAAGFTPGELARFQAALPRYLAGLYASRFGKGLDRQPEVTGTRMVRRDILVAARIPRSDGRDLPVEYRVRDIPGAGARVIDVMVGGTSFLILERDEFGALLRERGVGGLLTHLEAGIP